MCCARIHRMRMDMPPRRIEPDVHQWVHGSLAHSKTLLQINRKLGSPKYNMNKQLDALA